MSIINAIVNLGPVVTLPILIFVLCTIFGEKPAKGLMAGITIGIGFIGINLVINLLSSNLGPAVKALVKNAGLQLDVIDVGWPSAATIAFSSKVGALTILIGLAVNIIMLLTKTTKTVDVDIWNYWHFAFTGTLVAVATGSLTLGMIATAINCAIVLKIGDWTAPMVQEFCNLPGISFPQGFSAAYVPIAIPLNKLLDKIPVIKDIDINPNNIRKKFGVLGEPAIVGLILGTILGLAAKYDIKDSLNLGMSMAAVMFLMPRMVDVLVEGLMPVSEAAKMFIQKRFAGAEYYIGLDSSVAIGHPVVIATALILVPIAIILALIIPDNRVLPFGDLATLPSMVAMVAPICRGNVFRTVIIGTLIIGMGLLIATNIAPLHTQAAIEAALQFPEGATAISSICDGANPITWIILKIMQLLG